jgi:acetoin utilization deacetylase AcuC-like enzyme
MKIFFHERFTIPLPAHHRFPMQKYRLLWERIRKAAWVRPEDVVPATEAGVQDILRVHEPDYLRRLEAGELTQAEIRRIGLPWSPELVERARFSAGATIEACRAALQEGIAVNLGGGTHHAFPGHGKGYCLINDAAIAARAMQAGGAIDRALIVDCDVHQGDGTAAVFREDPSVFTFSIHGAGNFPAAKQQSDLDIGLPDGCGDEEYLAALSRGLGAAIGKARAGLAIYLSGADPFEADRFGRLRLSKEGLRQRDRLVFDRFLEAGLPAAVVMAGGYAPQVEDIVDIHFQTVRAARGFWEAWQSRSKKSA